MATLNSMNRNDLLFRQGSCKILLKQGDLFDEKDVGLIVIPTPSQEESDPDSFVIFKSFKSKANDYFIKEARRIRPNLKSQRPDISVKNDRGYIFVIPPFLKNHDIAHDLLKKNYSSCLNLAIENNFRSIAFPTIGCGGRGFDTKGAARLVFTAFEEILSTQNGKKMEEIRVVIYSDTVWKDFSEAFMDQALVEKTKINFVEPVSKTASFPETPSERNDKRTSQWDSHDDRKEDYPDDFETPAQSQQSQKKKITTRLDPDAPTFQTRLGGQRRELRRYYINKNNTELHILQGDILQQKVDAIVNAANESMSGGSGVDGAIHSAAGSELLKACKRHKEIFPDVRLPTGRSRILLSYDLRKTTYYIINTAGPRYDDYSSSRECKEKLMSCYKTSLALANLYDLETVAFTAISCGIYGYPIDEGAEVALRTVAVEAGSIRKLFFVLKDDDIYDAWVNAARKLGFQSMDKTDADPVTTVQQSRRSPSPSRPSDPSMRESVAHQASSNEGEKERVRNSDENDNEQPSNDSTNANDHGQNTGVADRDTRDSAVPPGTGRGRGRSSSTNTT